MIKELTEDFLMLDPKETFIYVKKGFPIYDLEYILLYEMDMYYWNDDDPIQETKYCIDDVAQFDFYFHIFMRPIDKRWYKLIEQDIAQLRFINAKDKKVILDGNVILRYFKLKELNLD
jgi:hypothetical protein